MSSVMHSPSCSRSESGYDSATRISALLSMHRVLQSSFVLADGLLDQPSHSFDRFNYVMQWRSDRDNRKSHPAPVDPHSAAANLPIGAIAGGHSALGATHAAAGSSQPGAANSPALSASGTRLKPKIRKDKAAEAPKGNAAPLPKRKKTTGGSALNATAQAAAMAAMRASANGSASNIAVDSNMAAYTHGNSWPS